MAMKYEAYGISHSADAWADILEVAPGTVRKHAKNPRNLEIWISERLGIADDRIRMALERGSPIEEQHDMARLLDLEWDLRNTLFRLEQTLCTFNREYAMKMSEADLALMRRVTMQAESLKDRVVAIRDEWITRCFR